MDLVEPGPHGLAGGERTDAGTLVVRELPLLDPAHDVVGRADRLAPAFTEQRDRSAIDSQQANAVAAHGRGKCRGPLGQGRPQEHEHGPFIEAHRVLTEPLSRRAVRGSAP